MAFCATLVLSAIPAIAGNAVYVNPSEIDGYDNPTIGGAVPLFAAGHVSLASPVMGDMSFVFVNDTPAYALTGPVDNPVRNDNLTQMLDFMYGDIHA